MILIQINCIYVNINIKFLLFVIKLEEQTRKLKFERSSWRKAINFAWTRLPDPLTRRQLKLIAVKGRNALTEDKFNEVILFLWMH